jgi:hypothetical protein
VFFVKGVVLKTISPDIMLKIILGKKQEKFKFFVGSAMTKPNKFTEYRVLLGLFLFQLMKNYG